MAAREAREIIATIRRDLEDAADMMLAAAEKGLRDIASMRAGDPVALDGLERTFCAILEACAFQDLTGQRLSKLSAMIDGVGLSPVETHPLLNGPAMPGQGLSQAAADRLAGFGDGDQS